MNRILSTLAGAVGVVALAGFGRCGPPRSHGPAEMAAFVTDRVDDALDDLDATPAQRTQIRAIEDRLLARAAAMHEGREAAGAELLAEWQSQDPDRAKLHALVDQRIDELRAFAHEAVDDGIEVHGILSPEQRAKVTRKLERIRRTHHP